MFGCSNNSLYFLGTARIIEDFEDELNNSLGELACRSASSIEFKELKHLPLWGKYVRIQTRYFLRNSDDLEYNYDLLEKDLLDEEFCDMLAKSIAGKKIKDRNKVFHFSVLSGRRFRKNYLIIFWR